MRLLKLASFILVFSLPIAAQATIPNFNRTFRVNCDFPHASINGALKRAKDGDTILVTGACIETVTIDKSITLEGYGAASISPEDSSDATISVNARDVTIRGFMLEDVARFQVSAFGGASVTVESNTIRNAFNFGVSAAANSFVILLGNTITDNTSGVISISGANVRIGVRRFTDVPVPNYIANNLENGVLVISNSTSDILGGNTISGNGNGIVVADGSQARIAGNEISGNRIGIFSNTNGTVQLSMASNPNPLLTAFNSGANSLFGIACKGGSITGVVNGLAPAVTLAPTAGVLSGPKTGLPTFCFDQTELLP